MSKGFKQKEVKHWRDELYRELFHRYRKDVEFKKQTELFNYLEEVMGDLLSLIRNILKHYPLKRQIGAAPMLVPESHPEIMTVSRKGVDNLQAKLAVLANCKLIKRARHYYLMSERFVTYLRQS